MPGWAEAFMTLRVDKSQVKKDVDAGLQAADGTAAGKRMGGQFGDALTKEAQPRLRDMHGRFISDSGQAGDRAGQAAGRSFAAAFAQLTKGIVVEFLKGASAQLGGGGGAGGGNSFLGRVGAQGGSRGVAGSLAAGAGPNILGLSVLSRAGAIGGAGALGLGALPALAAGGAVPLAAGAGAGLIAAGAGQLIGSKQQQGPLYKQATDALASIRQAFAASATTLVQPLQQAFATIPGLVRSIAPALQQAFAGAATLIQPVLTGLTQMARTVLPLLGQMFRAVAPLLGPLITGLSQLLGGLLPGLITLLHAAAPAVNVLANFLGALGTQLGSMLSSFAPVIQSSSVLLGSILSVVTSLLPIIGQLAGIFATALAPAFTQFAALIQTSLPFLTLIGQVVAQLASAILGALSAALGAAISLFTAIQPALTGFLRAISGIFVVLENTGLFTIFANAIESLAAPIASLISALLRGLIPILPPIINLIGQMSAILATGLASAIGLLLPPLTQLATQALALIGRFLPPLIPLFSQLATQLSAGLVQAVAALLPALTQLATVALVAMAQILPVLVPLLVQFSGFFTAAVVGAVRGVAVALSAIVTAVPVPVILGIAAAFAAWRLTLLGMAAVKGIIDGVRVAVLIFQSSTEVAAVKSAAAWVLAGARIIASFIAQAAAATAAYIAENLATLGIIAAITALVAAVIYLATHWHQVWTDVKNWTVDAWHAIYNTVLSPLINWFTVSLPHGFDVARGHVHAWWSETANAFRAGWNDVWSHSLGPVTNWLTVTLPHAFSTAWGQVQQWWRNVTSAFANGWNTVWSHVIAPMQRLFTNDLGSWFHTAVTAVGNFWSGLGAKVRQPVAWVVDNVLDGLIRVFDTIVHAIGLDQFKIAEVHPFGLAAGGKVTGPGGPRSDRAGLYALSDTEWVIQSRAAQKYGDPAMAAVNEGRAVIGYADGGKVGQNPPDVGAFGVGAPQPGTAGGLAHAVAGIVHKAIDIGKITAAIFSGNAAALTNAFSDLTGARSGASGLLGQILTQVPKTLVGDVVKWLITNGGGSGNSIVQYAMSFLGRIPYVWGGTSVPGGADCSGFVQAVYEHFGIGAPRTSEAQGAWVTRGGPTPGGLAFYHSPPGGPDPGHVAIVKDALTVISQGGGMGPQIMGLHAMPLLWTGTPPGGFGKSGPTGPAASGALQAYARALVDQRWGDGQWGAFADIVQRESGWQVNAINPTSGAYGIPQSLPGSKMASAGADWRTSGYTQLRWMVDYIASRWGTPGNADANERTAHWYGQGGPILEPVTGVGRYSRALYSFGENGREWVTPGGMPAGGDGAALGGVAARLDRIASILERAPGRTAAGVANAVAEPARTAALAARIGAR